MPGPRRQWLRAVLLAALLAILYLCWPTRTPPALVPRPVESTAEDNLVLVIKTGATEIAEKLPVHIETTFTTWKEVLIFADYADSIANHTIHDALQDITPAIRTEHPDFDLYRRVHAHGRSALHSAELSTARLEDGNDPNGKLSNPGWRLARFMNLPMAVNALDLKPEAHWYVFADADTYISHRNILLWTAQLDHTQPVYIGSEIAMDGGVFAHGGSGYILSSAAVRRLAELYTEQQAYWDGEAARCNAGDFVLGRALNASGVGLTMAYPLLQGGDPAEMDFAAVVEKNGGRLACFPAVSYHHVDPGWMRLLVEFETELMATAVRTARPMTHRDVFLGLVLPRMTAAGAMDWDNGSDGLPDFDMASVLPSLTSCRAICAADRSCMQYSITPAGCKISRKITLGAEVKTGVDSGWMLDRIKDHVGRRDVCSGESWIST